VAVLRHLQDETLTPVAARLLIGRSPTCGLRLVNPHASSEHATVTWTGLHWEIKDLGSRNGTYVDGSRIEAGRAVKLTEGTRIAFGDPDASWEVVNDEPPSALAIDLDNGEMKLAVDGLLALPAEDAPELTYYQNATGDWIEESADETRTVQDQEVVQAGGRSWRIQLPFVSDHTPLLQIDMTLDAVNLNFAVSRDEERVEITLSHRGVERALDPREHGYVLLTLARARLEDESLPPPERGWRERTQLERMLAMDSNALNVAIHRARQQFLAAGVSGAAGIVEVRRKKRRLGTDRFRITHLD
jgi:hypothetical protein